MVESKAYNIDCKIGMNWFTNKHFNLGLSDGPYGIDGNSHRRNKSRGKATMSTDYHTELWDQPRLDTEYFNLFFNVTENQIIFGANYYPEICGVPFKTPRRNEWPIFMNEHPRGWIIWDKCNGNNTFNDCELIWTSFDRPTYIYQFMWSGMMQGSGMLSGNKMNAYKEKNQKRIHPTEKPIPLYDFIFQTYLPGGGKVIDTHLGSGSSRISADKTENIDFVAFELEEKYFNDEERRYNQYKTQAKIKFVY